MPVSPVRLLLENHFANPRGYGTKPKLPGAKAPRAIRPHSSAPPPSGRTCGSRLTAFGSRSDTTFGTLAPGHRVCIAFRIHPAFPRFVSLGCGSIRRERSGTLTRPSDASSICRKLIQMIYQRPNYAANPAIALWLQSTPPACRVAQLWSRRLSASM